MDFRLGEDQLALRAGMRELLARRFGRERLRAAVDPPGQAGPGTGAVRLDRALWRELGEAGFFELGEAGFFALRLPQERGGVGLGLPEAVLVFEEAGRALLPGPLVATHLAAGEVPGAATGECVVAAVDGHLVEWLEEADVVRGDVAQAVALRAVDPLTPVHRVPRAAPHDPVAALLTAAEQLGSAGRTCALAVQHARTREQFGRPVGAFQAVKHLCAEMLVRVETARSAVYAAAVTGDPLDIAAARLLADEAAERGARDCLQVHGGMGFTWESDVHLHLKRAWSRAHRGPCAAQAEEALAAGLLTAAERSGT
ncbi:acyl-CoA dehydrogenase family protein [Streptomyces apricus]|uniref:Acyl-CoA dehydrogenase n=1 Tax=Streptomyces apricus TaxID=1828112 RepID=A0A5B0BM34_9ACTN|nr:acyl-CoA dehydrogenase [Streptomyces apricus]KAA0942837.1 acyl-CoA dehydrogenase [Streptomyces apricus]